MSVIVSEDLTGDLTEDLTDLNVFQSSEDLTDLNVNHEIFNDNCSAADVTSVISENVSGNASNFSVACISPSVEDKQNSVHIWLNADPLSNSFVQNTFVVQKGEVETFQAEEVPGNDFYICEETISVKLSSADEEQDIIPDSDIDPRLAKIKSEIMREIETKDDPKIYKTKNLIHYWKLQEENDKRFVKDETKKVDDDIDSNAKKRRDFKKKKSSTIRKSVKLRNNSEEENKDYKRKKSFFKHLNSKGQIERKNSWGTIKEALSGITSPIMKRKAPFDDTFNGVELGNSFSEKNGLHYPKYKVGEVQDKFPNDKLELDLPLEEHDPKSSRRFYNVLSSSPRPYRRLNSNLASDIDSSHKHSNDDLNYNGNNSPNCSTRRLYVQEGQVKFTHMGSTNERFMFLFNDLLLVAKAKSATTFKLKDKVRVSEIWLSAAIDDITDTTLTPDRCFTIGWPTVNYIAGFNTSEEKDLWFKTLQKCRDEQQERLELKEVTVNVINKVNQEDSNSIQTATLTVTVKHDAKTVVKMAQEQFQIQPDENSLYQLWLATKEIPCPLIGHEIPYSIKVNHSRIRESLRDENYNPYDTIDFDASCQFYLRKSKQTATRMSLDLNYPQKKWKNPMKKSPIYHWAMNKKTTKYSTSAIGPGKLFGLSLTSLSSEEELIPKPIQNILVQLFRRGPGTTGIFRKSALQRTAKQIRENLDSGKDESMEDTSPIVLAAVIKDFFRSLPDSLIPSTLYESLVATKSAANFEMRLDEIKRIFQQFPKENYELTLKFINVLHHIQRFSDVNNMNSFNLSVCVSPSIMWPPLTIKMEATEQTSGTTDFISFLIDSFLAIFGSENEYILGSEEEIMFNDGPGEDSDSGTDQTIYRLKDETDWEKYDSEKEVDIPSTPIDLVSPTKSNLDSPFAVSDSSICTIDSDDVKQNSNHVSGLAMKPLLQASNKRELNENGRCDVSDNENTDFNEIFQRNLLRHPKHKRVLSSITTSAELIEHRRNIKVEDQSLEQKDSKNSKNFQDSKNESEIVPKKYIISHPVIKHFSTEYSVTPNVIFHSVDRRRQPAVPSYEEHIQKTQTLHRITKTNVRKKSIPPDQVLQLNVENYTPPVPPILENSNVQLLPDANTPFIQNDKSCDIIHDGGLNISNESNVPSDYTHFKSPNLTFTSIDPDSTNIRPVAIESLIATFQQFSSPVEKKAKRPSVERQNNVNRITETCEISQTENESLKNNHIERSINCVTTFNAVSVAAKNESHLNEKNPENVVIPEPKIISMSTNRIYLSSKQNTPTNDQKNETNMIEREITCSNCTDGQNETKNYNDKSSVINKYHSIEISKQCDVSSSNHEKCSPINDDFSHQTSFPILINDNFSQQPSQLNNPFSLKLKSEVKQNPLSIQDFRSQSLQLKKTCLTQAPKKIDQLTNCSLIKENQNKIITARELRRTNRRLKKEIRNAFNDGNFIYKCSDGHKSSENLNNYNSSHFKNENDKFNTYGYNNNTYSDNNNRILNSHTGLLTQDESYV